MIEKSKRETSFGDFLVWAVKNEQFREFEHIPERTVEGPNAVKGWLFGGKKYGFVTDDDIMKEVAKQEESRKR